MHSRWRRAMLLGLPLAAGAVWPASDIYQWRDEQGQIHFGDRDSRPANATPVELPPGNTPLPPPPAAPPAPEAETGEPPPPRPTAASWAQRHCRVTTRVLYTDYWLIPCLPTDEVSVYLCQREAPARFRRHFGTRYRYEDRSSECGPEVYEGEILYLKP